MDMLKATKNDAEKAAEILIRPHWIARDYQNYTGLLASFVDDAYRDFVLKGTPTDRPLLGVRTPRQRALAAKIVKGDYESFLEFPPTSFEEVNVRGFVVAALPYETMLKYFNGQVELIDNWGNCDCFCSSLKSVQKHRDDFLEKIDELLAGSEFFARTALVILLTQYKPAEYLPVIFDRVARVKDREEYYVKMAVAWLLAECYARAPEPTEAFILSVNLPKWTFNKTISKICDSLRVDAETKARLRELRKK